MSHSIYVIDRDPEVRARIRTLCEQMEVGYHGFESVAECLQRQRGIHPSCVVVEVAEEAGDLSNLREWLDHNRNPAALIATADGADLDREAELVACGAIALLKKPFRLEALKGHIDRATRLRMYLTDKADRLGRLNESFERLTPRQRQVLEHIESGFTNKKIAALLNISQRTVESERARILSVFETESSSVMVARATELRMLWEASEQLRDVRPSLVEQLATSSVN